ncbi:MAG: orotidine-5'-phosphate decarboxylase [Thioalkalispiraceae bacterium]|jgi:orotidine-5'-phosphate decarboxylase
MPNDSKIIVALDYPDAKQANQFISQIEAGSCKLKIGKELFTAEGPRFVETLVDKGFDVFLDLKFHDIPNTVARACSVAADLGVWMVNVHALGGRKMMMAAREALASKQTPPLLIAVTILTSMGKEDINELGLAGEPDDHVSNLAALAEQAGLDGVVCSPREVSMLRTQRKQDFQLITPGIRPAESEVGDQKRIMTPSDAIKAGSSFLVIGRPITQASDPASALSLINQEVAACL